MQHYKEFKRYSPELPEEKEIEDGINAIFLISINGEDWYRIQSSFSRDTVKIMYDEEMIIRAITKDVTLLYPEGCSVVELESISDNVTIDGSWQFMNNRVVLRELSYQELTQQALKKKQLLLNNADRIISPLRDAIELDIATQEEKSRYMAWKKYNVMVNRVDLSDVENINWPECPD